MNSRVAYCITGPTCSGKSTLAHTLAREHGFELISIDSGMIYRSMDIGTDKPSRQWQQQVPYHLIDCIDPPERYSSARFCRDAFSAMGRMFASRKTPLLVGGTMMYAQALLANWFSVQADQSNLVAYAYLPYPKQQLDRMVAERFEAMLEAGLEEECRSLLTRYPNLEQSPAYRLVGYRQVFSYLRGQLTRGAMLDRALAATRQLAKKQFTWLRGYSFGLQCDSASMLTDTLLSHYHAHTRRLN